MFTFTNHQRKQIKAILGYQLTPLELLLPKAAEATQGWRGCEGKITAHCWQKCKFVQPLWKQCGSSNKNLKLTLPYDSAIWFMNKYPKELKTILWRCIYSPRFTVALLTVAKIQKCPWKSRNDLCIFDVWIKNVLFILKKRMPLAIIQVNSRTLW